MRARLRGRNGQALAEFAIILPVLFLLIAGIIEFGRGWNIKQVVTDAAREGARYTVIVDASTMTDVTDRVKQRLSLGGLLTTDPPTTISITPAASFKCGDGTGGVAMTVLVTTQYRLGWLGVIMQWGGGTSTITISSKATMRNEC